MEDFFISLKGGALEHPPGGIACVPIEKSRFIANSLGDTATVGKRSINPTFKALG